VGRDGVDRFRNRIVHDYKRHLGTFAWLPVCDLVQADYDHECYFNVTAGLAEAQDLLSKPIVVLWFVAVPFG
jgi:hypothetical protein